MQTHVHTLLCFGKIPTHGDFVRHHADGGAARAMDAWIQQGMFALKTRGDGALQATYERAGPARFIFRARNSRVFLAGVVLPSKDRVGRRFPLVVACELEDRWEEAAPQAMLPSELDAFLTAVTELAVDAASGAIAYPDLPQQLDAVAPPPMRRGGASAYQDYLVRTTWGTFVERMWGFFDDGRKYVLFKQLLELLEVAALRGGAAWPPLRFPLSEQGWSGGLEPSFWLDLVDRLTGSAGARPTALWSAGGEVVPHLTVFPGAPAAGGFLDLVDGAGSGVVHLQETARTDSVAAVLGLPPGIGRLIEDEALSLREVLDELRGDA